MDPQQILDSVFSTSGAAVAAAFIGVLVSLLQQLVPGIPATGPVRNWVIAIGCAILVAVAASGTGQTPNAANVFGAVLAWAAITGAALAAHGVTSNASGTAISS